MRTRIMYIEDKSQGLTGPCRIGRVSFSKTGRSLSYAGRTFQSLTGAGFKANYFDVATGEQFWISGPRRDGADGLYGRITQPEDVDADVAEAYWREIRGLATAPARRGVARGADLSATSEVSEDATAAYRGKGRKHARIGRALSREAVDAVLAEAQALRDRIHPPFTTEEILEMLDEGRR